MRKHRFLGVLLSLVLLAGLIPAMAFAADTGESGEPAAATFDISKSKEATELKKAGDKYESTVTLSLPSAEKELVTDVVFVLDKSTSAELEEQALNMLSDLKTEIAESGAKVKVGVVIFNKKANVTDFMDLETQYGDIEEAIQQKISSGTNTHAGLIAGRKMLDDDTAVSADRKYLVFVSDGITYMFNEDPTAVAWSFMADAEKHFAGPDNWASQYGNNDAPKDWSDTLAKIGAKSDAQDDAHDYQYGTEPDPEKLTDVSRQDAYANSVEKALYLTEQEYKNICSKYHCYAMNATKNIGQQYAWGPSFMEYLADGKTVDFSDIQNDILYLVDHGSSIEDYMGYVEGDYNFDLKDLESVTLTVNGKKLDAAVDKENNMIVFGDKQFKLEYFPADNEKEHFVLHINQKIMITEPVQLTYKVVLQDPKTKAGTYGKYDQYGANGYDGLFTNNSAVINPVDSAGTEYAAQAFNKPTVSYTVAAPAPAPAPADKPAASETNTGDNSNMMLWIAAAVVSALALAGIAFVSRRKRA
ncbi:von Willebrand factor type A domain [uncultured Eubacterium sp.]|uniref:vWA domain-containing protein n=1 Tax=Brotomerdimonas butyrica TaxID=2981721 RepID=UPI000823268B|nr:vWA domain-containing protein [Brotomerdimonas butyrica]MCU6755820.1 VWA domain-containing protein [Brotomerdimonas butyrica]SCH51758.1 von Willebrand factor type A domain [uncultured Eubacterium sp.]